MMDAVQKIAAISDAIERYEEQISGLTGDLFPRRIEGLAKNLVRRIGQALHDEDWRETEA